MKVFFDTSSVDSEHVYINISCSTGISRLLIQYLHLTSSGNMAKAFILKLQILKRCEKSSSYRRPVSEKV